ncbi:polysaccharide deacetylase family protein [uncultured Parabacteroides sp.]|uniref:polysaccharide deacetylase family protein n=1 Tax=uncultured Parabacteroides sp. TaxID=512312 RepID=UPI002614B466|nr:polysaccharide deacetylase family protein [uncultured Parabacteroides sp.]
MNVLTFDIEEWFHLLDNDSTRTEEQWKHYEVRIYKNIDRIFRILDETNSKATFFVIGWIAKTYPDIVRRIAEKYQIGSHTMNHQLVWQQSPKEFKDDVECSIKLLEDISGKKVEAFRAPGFSITEKVPWAFEVLAECGIKYDSSIFPASHAHGGMPSYPTGLPSVIKKGDMDIKEFPITFKTIGGKHIVFSGGGYFRFFPYFMISQWTKEYEDYLISYIHPRDLDAGQPMVEGLDITRRFRSYCGLKGAEKKLRKWLTDFQFVDIKTADKSIDWNNAKIVKF